MVVVEEVALVALSSLPYHLHVLHQCLLLPPITTITTKRRKRSHGGIMAWSRHNHSVGKYEENEELMVRMVAVVACM